LSSDSGGASEGARQATDQVPHLRLRKARCERLFELLVTLLHASTSPHSRESARARTLCPQRDCVPYAGRPRRPQADVGGQAREPRRNTRRGATRRPSPPPTIRGPQEDEQTGNGHGGRPFGMRRPRGSASGKPSHVAVECVSSHPISGVGGVGAARRDSLSVRDGVAQCVAAVCFGALADWMLGQRARLGQLGVRTTSSSPRTQWAQWGRRRVALRTRRSRPR
jgi:hypothetical protein